LKVLNEDVRSLNGQDNGGIRGARSPTGRRRLSGQRHNGSGRYKKGQRAPAPGRPHPCWSR